MAEVLEDQTQEEEAANAEEVVSSNNLVETTAKKKLEGEDEERSATVYLNLGATASEMISMFGDQVVHDLAIRSAKIKAQAQIRAYLEAGKTQEQITSEFQNWRPDVDRTPTKDPMAMILSSYERLTDEQKEAIRAQLQN